MTGLLLGVVCGVGLMIASICLAERFGVVGLSIGLVLGLLGMAFVAEFPP